MEQRASHGTLSMRLPGTTPAGRVGSVHIWDVTRLPDVVYPPVPSRQPLFTNVETINPVRRHSGIGSVTRSVNQGPDGADRMLHSQPSKLGPALAKEPRRAFPRRRLRRDPPGYRTGTRLPDASGHLRIGPSPQRTRARKYRTARRHIDLAVLSVLCRALNQLLTSPLPSEMGTGGTDGFPDADGKRGGKGRRPGDRRRLICGKQIQ